MTSDVDSLLSALDADPLASLLARDVAGVAFASVGVDVSSATVGHLAALSTDALELDLNDPLQRNLGDYELVELIGEGGMGVVYRARQISLDREVAIKLLAAGPWASEDFIRRFRQEAQNAARMQHPNVVPIYEVGNEGELHFFSMRLIDGPSLATQLKEEKRFSPRRAAAFVRVVAEAVDYAHRLGVLHLDLKPANVLLDRNNIPYVADFGLARRLQQGLVVDNYEVSGTPSYMAPEQAIAGSQAITPATDIWGLGAILYELLVGSPPFVGKSAHATLKLVTDGSFKRPREMVPSIPLDLEAIVLKCLCRDVKLRYSDARALADDLARFLDNRAVRARPLHPGQHLARWCQRQPYLAGLAFLLLVSLLGGAIGVTTQWRRAEDNAQTSLKRLQDSRRDLALRLEEEGKGYEALPQLVANIEDADRYGAATSVEVERREIPRILSSGVQLLKSVRLPDAGKASPFAAELSPNGKIVAVAMSDLTVHWYEAESLHEVGRVDLLGLPNSSGSPQIPTLLRFIDDHHLRVTLDWIDFFTAPQEANTYVIDLDASALRPMPSEFTNLSDANFSSDGKLAILRNTRQQIQLWETEPWRAVSPLVNETADQEIQLIGPRGRFVATIGSEQKSLVFYDPHSLKKIRQIVLPTTEGLAAWATTRDGSLLALGDFQGRVYLLDVDQGTLRQLPTTVGREVTWVAFSEDDAWLAAVRRDGATFAFEVATGNAIGSEQMQSDFELRQVRILHNERLLIASGLGKSSLWRLPPRGPTEQPAYRLISSPVQSSVSGPYSLGFCATTGTLVSAETNGEVRLWRVSHSPLLPARTARLLPITSNFDGKHVVDVALDKLRIVSINDDNASEWTQFPQPLGFAELVDSSQTVIATYGQWLTVLDAATMKPRFAPIDLDATPMRLAVNNRASVVELAFPSLDKRGFAERVASLDLRTGARLASVVVPGPLRELRLSPDGTVLALVGNRDVTTRLVDSRALTLLHDRIPQDEHVVVATAFSKGGESLYVLEQAVDQRRPVASVSNWDVATNTQKHMLDIPDLAAVGVMETPSGVVIGGRDSDLFLTGTNQLLRVPAAPREQGIAAIALSHDERVVARGYESSVQLYDTRSGVRIGPPLRADLTSADVVAQLTFSDDDKTLLARTLQGRWVVWSTDEATSSGADLRQWTSALNSPSDASASSSLLQQLDTRRLHEWRLPVERPVMLSDRSIGGDAIPKRDDNLKPNFIDLTPYYDTAPATVLNPMHALVPTMNQLPLGLVRIDGVDFDVRGAVQVRQFTSTDRATFLNALHSIPVAPERIAAVHLLMLDGLLSTEAAGEPLVRLRYRYNDGSTEEVPLRSGELLPIDVSLSESVPYGWVWGDYQRLIGESYLPMLNNPRVANPHPERSVASIDVDVVAIQNSTFVFFAMTAEPVIGPAKSGISSIGNPGTIPFSRHEGATP